MAAHYALYKNDEIIKTIQTSPDKMLERNNGIVFKAEEVSLSADGRTLVLSQGSIVNGCQTTMCLVDYAAEDNHSSPGYVMVKIVQTDNSWDVARAANYQNYVADIDLNLASNLRPQLAKRAAAMAGYRIDEGARSPFQIIDELYDQKLNYDETRLLYIGFFSRTPNNVFAPNYTELMQGLIDKFYKTDPQGTNVFETLFILQHVSKDALEEANFTFKHPSYAKMIERFYREDSLSYRCFVSILAICGSLNLDITKHESDVSAEYERMRKFFDDAATLLHSRKSRFVRYYILAVKLWVKEVMPSDADDTEIRRDMSSTSRRANFSGMLRNLNLEADDDERLKQEEEQFQRTKK